MSSGWKEQVAAVTRNYFVEPRLGKNISRKETNELISSQTDYRTVSGVNGPLVILDKVKVGRKCHQLQNNRFCSNQSLQKL